MVFKKGNIPWNKRKKISSEHKRKIGLGCKKWHRDVGFSKETIKKLRLANLGEKNPMYGEHHSEKTKRKIGLASKGRKKTHNQSGKNNPFYGKKHTLKSREKISKNHADVSGNKNPSKRPEVRKKISLANTGKKRSKKTRRKIKEARAKQITPKKDTKIEVKLQNFLKKLGIEFSTHSMINQIKHSYQCDILIPSMNLIIEADGDYWHGNPLFYPKSKLSKRQKEQKEKDKLRTKELIEKGFKVLRLWENEIKEMELEDFITKHKKVLESYEGAE